jgi:hypothetical protein
LGYGLSIRAVELREVNVRRDGWRAGSLSARALPDSEIDIEKLQLNANWTQLMKKHALSEQSRNN